MPCVDIADSIVQTGRATLEKSIEVISRTVEWNANVVYGDTDSLFVHLPGTSKHNAFRIGQEIVDTVNKMVPQPMKLKFEKVYLPCVLLTKKRYVGFKFEYIEEQEPVFDAKGIETVRRDGCPAAGKVLEKSLKILFRSRNLSELKTYLYRQWQKIMTERVNIQDFIIAKEVKLGTYINLPPGALLAKKKMESDPRAEPPYGERVPYLVAYNGMEHRLMDCIVSPDEFLKDK
jgi:DNA polymerase elongation subunit (family B)